MNRISRFALPLALAAALTLGACSGDADIDINADSTAGDDTVTLTPADSGLPTNADSNSTSAPDTVGGAIDSAGAAAGDAVNGVQNETIEKMVEAQLAVAPGFSGVDVESEGDGVIVLTGSVATDQEKTDAEAEAKKINGVKSVKNNITVKK